jgi:PIN domain nuclease of toxin-antitoxin system
LKETCSLYLLDTNAAVIALAKPDLLSPAVRKAVLRGPNTLSVLSYWEVLLKVMKGKLDVNEPRTWWLDAIDQLGASQLLLRPEHVSAIRDLPTIHQDPFDRALIAQAIVEKLTFVTLDKEIRRYASEYFRVLA